MDRRAVFFLMAAVVAGLLIPLVPEDATHPAVQYVGPILVVSYLVLALLSFLDHTSRRREPAGDGPEQTPDL